MDIAGKSYKASVVDSEQAKTRFNKVKIKRIYHIIILIKKVQLAQDEFKSCRTGKNKYPPLESFYNHRQCRAEKQCIISFDVRRVTGKRRRKIRDYIEYTTRRIRSKPNR